MTSNVSSRPHFAWWGGWPWKWRFYLVRRSKWGPFGELMLGPLGITWATSICGATSWQLEGFATCIGSKGHDGNHTWSVQ